MCVKVTMEMTLLSTSLQVPHTQTHTHTPLLTILSIPHTGNPIVIPQKTVVGLKKGFRRAGHPSLIVFTSGTPTPTLHNHTWFFNGTAIFTNGEATTEADETYTAVNFNKIVLNDQIVPSIGGLYQSVVETSAGRATADIQVNVEGKFHVL